MIKILTLSWNGKERLETLYNSLLPTFSKIKYQWLIKDNGSKDGTVSFIENLNNPNIHLIKTSHNNDTFAHGCNLLFRESNANQEDFILLLNNDIVFNDDKSLINMMSIMEKDENVGVVGAKLKYTNTDIIQHAGVIFNSAYALPIHFGARQKDNKLFSKNREFQAVTGAVWLTKAKYYENICTANKSGLNGQNESLIWCYDDIDACLAIKYNLNKKIICCGETDIFHEESASLKKNSLNKLFLNQNINTFKNKWGGRYILDQNLYEKDLKYNIYV